MRLLFFFSSNLVEEVEAVNAIQHLIGAFLVDLEFNWVDFSSKISVYYCGNKQQLLDEIVQNRTEKSMGAVLDLMSFLGVYHLLYHSKDELSYDVRVLDEDYTRDVGSLPGTGNLINVGLILAPFVVG